MDWAVAAYLSLNPDWSIRCAVATLDPMSNVVFATAHLQEFIVWVRKVFVVQCQQGVQGPFLLELLVGASRPHLISDELTVEVVVLPNLHPPEPGTMDGSIQRPGHFWWPWSHNLHLHLSFPKIGLELFALGVCLCVVTRATGDSRGSIGESASLCNMLGLAEGIWASTTFARRKSEWLKRQSRKWLSSSLNKLVAKKKTARGI